MDVRCKKCGKVHSIPDNSVVNKKVHFFCSECSNKIVIDTTINAKVNINFGDENDFKFLSVNGSGYTASKIFVLLQLIDKMCLIFKIFVFLLT